MKNLIFSILALLMLFSCKPESEVQILHDNYSFNFPMSVEESIEKLDLIYGCYHGFYKVNKKDSIQEIYIQLENSPLFSGNDNVEAEFYHKENVSGVTFYYLMDSVSIGTLKSKYESFYNTQFEKVSALKEMEYLENSDTMTYIKASVGKNLTLIIKEVDWTFYKKKFSTISYYYNLSDRELRKFTSYI